MRNQPIRHHEAAATAKAGAGVEAGIAHLLGLHAMLARLHELRLAARLAILGLEVYRHRLEQGQLCGERGPQAKQGRIAIGRGHDVLRLARVGGCGYHNRMSRYDFKTQRLFVEHTLTAGISLSATPDQAHYLANVLRMKAGDAVLLFNGRDGEWRAEIASAGKRALLLQIVAQTRPQDQGPDLHYLFAPLKRARLDYMIEKATEMGVARLQPVLTRYTTPERVNLERMRANAIEAAEQCGILRIPEIADPVRLEKLLEAWDPARRLIFCDEDAPVGNPIEALRAAGPGSDPMPGRGGASHDAGARGLTPVALLIGPEGGFAQEERALLLAHPGVIRLSLGPRILRADTAAVAALALISAALCDGR
jgi:16S rRNA (uracil1498-N3)-methyltransferase